MVFYYTSKKKEKLLRTQRKYLSLVVNFPTGAVTFSDLTNTQ